MTSIQLAQTLLWCIPLINLVGLLGQVRTNYYRKSTDGMSFWMLWTSHLAVISFVMYCHLLDLPLSLRVLVPIEGLVVTFLVIQEIWYAPSYTFRRQITVWHGGILVSTSCVWYASLFVPTLIGSIAGWTGVLMVAIAQFPQIWQHWRRKSVVGYSKTMLASATLSSALLIWISVVLSLPLPSLANGIRALVKRLIIWWQVFLYYER